MTEFLDEGTHDEFEFSFLIDFRLVDFCGSDWLVLAFHFGARLVSRYDCFPVEIPLANFPI